MPPFPMGFGGERLIPMIQSSVAPATWSGYGKAWGEWLLLVAGRRVDTDDTVRLEVTTEYMLQLRELGVSSSVVQKKLSGVSFHFKLRGWEDVTKTFVIRQALKGWKREHVRTESRRPISYALLVQLLNATDSQCSSVYEASLFKASFCLAFFAALRVGELVPPARARAGGLMMDDVVLANNSLRIRIRRSKTDVLGRGEWVPLHSVQGPACPVSVVASFLSCRAEGLHFLVHADGSPVTRFQFQLVLKKCLGHAGVSPGDYGTHSFRIGAATEASRAGLSNSDVQRIGRWRSACFAGYVRPELLD